MSLTAGTRLGVYEIGAPIGEGGMGQVFRATDTRLKRAVAIKILAPALAHDADRLARFQREAEVLASLNHPHIAGIYGLEDAGGVKALVMEFVQGETLAHRISRGLVPVDEALPMARQIAEALEAAHEQGIVHRDLKPANVMVREDGTVKVLDFGLAKMLESPSAPPGVSLSPTIASPGMTQAGLILGTAAYMSPEQARGKLTDKRSDVWAFGCVLFEMLAGIRAFEGEEVTDVIAAVVRAEPNWDRLPPDTPAGVRRLLRWALRKDRRQRLADMADVRLELEEAATEEPARTSPPPKAPALWRRPVTWAIVGAASILLSVVAAGLRGIGAREPDARIVRFDLAPPAGNSFDWGQPISPDGRTLAFIARSDGTTRVWIRPLDASSARAVPGTEGATRSFWSPDSQHVAFFSDGNLNEVGIDGSGPRLIARGPFRDGAWNADGVLLVGGQLGRPLMRVSQLGGEPVAETALDQSLEESSHDYPEFLPDRRHYIFMVRRGVRTDDFITYVGTLGSSERRQLPGIRSAVKYSPSGHLLFLRGRTLMAQAFRSDRLELSGDAFPIAEQAAGTRVATFSISRTGTLAFTGGLSTESQLTWFDRTGTRLGPMGPAGVYGGPRLSPDARGVAFERGTPADVWLFDVTRMAASKLTSDRTEERQPVWSPNGQVLAFASNRGGSEGLYERSAEVGGDDRLLLQSDAPMALSDWSRDGHYLAYAARGDVWALPLSGARKPLQLTTTPIFEEAGPVFSPDGRWIAYQSGESSSVTRSGAGDVFVQSFPQRGFRRQVSTAGGFAARWSANGSELFYLAPDGMLMAVSVAACGSALEVGVPKPLFRPRLNDTPLSLAKYDVASDGRFLVREGASDLSITVIINWLEQMKRRGE